MPGSETMTHTLHRRPASVAPCRRRPSCSGFTLIEIAVVLVIVGMMAMIVFPRLPSSQHENLKSSARTLAATLRYLQDRSATGRAGYVLIVEPGTDLLKIAEVAADGGTRDPDDPLLRKRVLQEGVVAADVVVPRLGKVSDGQVKLMIGAGGMRDFTVFHLRSADNRFWTVMVFPSGGKVKVYEGYQEEPA